MLNIIEPPELIELFLKFPPYNFSVRKNNGVILFEVIFDILTTADESIAKQLMVLENIPILKGFFRPAATFVGATVSEYLILPDIDVNAFISSIFEGWDTEYLIVKDIPKNSPLLSERENLYSDHLIDSLEKRGFVTIAGQALAYRFIDFASIDEYLMKFSQKRRYDFRRKLKKKPDLKLEIEDSGKSFDEARVAEYYQMYENVYNKSYVHFDKLTPDFFMGLLRSKNLGAKIFSYYTRTTNELIGYKVCFQGDDILIDKIAGFKYPQALDMSVYFVSWFDNLQYCLDNKLKKFVIGWTNPEVKAYLGADFNFTHHCVYPRNPLIRKALKYFSRYFESDKNEFERFMNKKS
jgi:predicted N-acyltransferase